MARVYVCGVFDDMRSGTVRFLEEAGRLGPVTAVLWPDEDARGEGGEARFGLAERRYFLESIRWVERVEVREQGVDSRGLGIRVGPEAALWAIPASPGREEEGPSGRKRAWCAEAGVEYRVIAADPPGGARYAPCPAPRGSGENRGPTAKKVIVTGCFDWLHTGHVRFFEEAAAYGELTVVVGRDANVRLLKGAGHPLHGEEERRYLVGAIRFVANALVSSGSGWLDAEPEIRRLGPDRYVVNEDGDRPEKRRYCEENGIEYIVLERRPKEGLPPRTSTDLRGF